MGTSGCIICHSIRYIGKLIALQRTLIFFKIENGKNNQMYFNYPQSHFSTQQATYRDVSNLQGTDSALLFDLCRVVTAACKL